MKIENEIISSVIAAVKELYGQDVPEKMVALQKTKSNFEGNLTLVVFPFLKMSKKKPEDTAQEIGEYLKKTALTLSQTSTWLRVSSTFLSLLPLG